MNNKKQVTSNFHATSLWASTIRLFLFLGFVAFVAISCAPPEDTPDCDNTSDAKETDSCPSEDTPPEDTPPEDTPPEDTPLVDAVDLFISTWRTTGANEDVVIPVNSDSYTYDYSVDCDDDGTFELVHQTGNATCSFAVAGDHKIKISGTFPALYIFGDVSTKDKFIAINNWGTNKWKSMKSAFQGATNFNSITATDTPDFSMVTDMSYMFTGASNFNQSLAGFNTDNVTDMSYMFTRASNFNQSLAGFNTDNVTNMSFMFNGASNFNQSLAGFNTAKVTDMGHMFNRASKFNQSLASFDTAEVNNMPGMFFIATLFNQPLAHFKTAKVTNMSYMFDSSSFNQDISGWDVDMVTDYRFFSSVTLTLGNTPTFK